MTVTPLGRDQDCSLKNREPDVPAPWFLDPGGWSKTAAVRLYFIFPGICTLSLSISAPLSAAMCSAAYLVISTSSFCHLWQATASSCCLALDSFSSFPCPTFLAIAKSGSLISERRNLMETSNLDSLSA
ncbi:hypothetical protein STEG23_017927 [Scotinomys teguina]